MQPQLAMFIQNIQVGVRSSKSGRPPWSTLRAFYLSPNRCKLTNAASLRTKSWQRFINDWIRTCVEPLARRNVMYIQLWLRSCLESSCKTISISLPKVMFARSVNMMSIWSMFHTFGPTLWWHGGSVRSWLPTSPRTQSGGFSNPVDLPVDLDGLWVHVEGLIRLTINCH